MQKTHIIFILNLTLVYNVSLTLFNSCLLLRIKKTCNVFFSCSFAKQLNNVKYALRIKTKNSKFKIIILSFYTQRIFTLFNYFTKFGTKKYIAYFVSVLFICGKYIT